MPTLLDRSRVRPLNREDRNIRGVVVQTLGGALLIATLSGALMLASAAWRAL